MQEIIYELKKLIDTEIKVDLYFDSQSFMEVHIDNVTEDYVKFHNIEIDFGDYNQTEKNLEEKVTSKLITYFYSLDDLKGISYCIMSIPSDLNDLTDFDGQEFLQ